MKRSFNGKISCLMVTKPERTNMARRAIEAFVRQTWADKELVIISEQNTTFTTGFLVDNVIRFIAPDGMTLGDLRNYGTARCSGDYVAQWDDDDVSHPDRLKIMADMLLGLPHEVDGVYLDQHTGAWPEKDRYWISHSRRWECTTLLKRHKITIYPALRKGEDTPVMKNLILMPMSEPHLYVRVVHGANTWNPGHFEDHWEKRERVLHALEKEVVKGMLAW